ncbi:Zinc finger A20 and AN1 domain-containing stress-associated protein 9 [Acorus calamus]|uniref:Zinc finger A20 and AN1 domain-containing stress-associated protein 9 n=1 Tax=Acorus calamus TaxID=4465 RepID=A0AAV9D712_ACOCL|nr:Zinc finger A20 and AN1 domain-containing stress-associated protein 9 [Acorus calamus]
MAQESYKNETDETECQAPEKLILCANNCGFFGNSSTNNHCSKCFRDLFMHQQQQQQLQQPKLAQKAPTSLASISAQPEPAKLEAGEPSKAVARPATNRCLACNRRVGLNGFKCRCGGTFCGSHRYSELHGCDFDYRGYGREGIAKANPVVKAEKVEKI